MQVFILVAMNKRDHIAAGYALTAPLGAMLIYAILLDSSIRITMGRGITWKGRAVYSQLDVRPPRVSMKEFFRLSTGRRPLIRRSTKSHEIARTTERSGVG